MRYGTFIFLTLCAATPAIAEGDAARGEYLVQSIMACGNCHTPMGPNGFERDRDLSGRLVEKLDAFTAIAPNLTPAGRVADWSDEELAHAIREGVRPDGSIIGPPMPFAAYRSISDEDLDAIVAYIRTLPPVENDPGTSSYSIPLPPAYGPPIESVSAPERGVTPEYGEYLVALGHCMECHSPLTPTGPDWGEGFARGGFEFHGPWGTSVSRNLTDHPDGLANYTDEQIKTMITEGKQVDGSQLMPPMPYGHFAQMTDEDIDAVIAYLRTIPGQPDL